MSTKKDSLGAFSVVLALSFVLFLGFFRDGVSSFRVAYLYSWFLVLRVYESAQRTKRRTGALLYGLASLHWLIVPCQVGRWQLACHLCLLLLVLRNGVSLHGWLCMRWMTI
jgi:hypothetical protein